MKKIFYALAGILGFAATFVPVYYADAMVGDCIDPYNWTVTHTHPEMLYTLVWVIVALPFLVLGIKHSPWLCSEDNSLREWQKALALGIFYLLPALSTYASNLSIGCPYAVQLQHGILYACLGIAIISLLMYLHGCKQKN